MLPGVHYYLHRHDFSGYPKSRVLYDTSNKKVISEMKDETASIPVNELVGLRAKIYSMILGDAEKKTAKGTSKAVIKSRVLQAISFPIGNSDGVYESFSERQT